jgi:hypothetical protein
MTTKKGNGATPPRPTTRGEGNVDNTRRVRRLIANQVPGNDRIGIGISWGAAEASNSAFARGGLVPHQMAVNAHLNGAAYHRQQGRYYIAQQHAEAAEIHARHARSLAGLTANEAVGNRSHLPSVLPHRAGSIAGRNALSVDATRRLAREAVLVPHQRLVANENEGEGSNAGVNRPGNIRAGGAMDDDDNYEPPTLHISGGDGSRTRGFDALVARGIMPDWRSVSTLTPDNIDVTEDEHSVASRMAALPPSIPLEKLTRR